MRWKSPKEGDVQFVKRFLWFPLTIGTKTIWLERVYIKQEYFACLYLGWWSNVGFLEGDGTGPAS